MVIRDSIGNPLKEGDGVVFSIGSELALGKVVVIHDPKVQVVQGNQPEQPPYVVVQTVVQRQVMPNGLTVGLIKAVDPKPSLT